MDLPAQQRPGGGERVSLAPIYQKTTLKNGVRVVTGPMTGVRSASLIFYYGVGSRFERPAISGVSKSRTTAVFGSSNTNAFIASLLAGRLGP